MCMTLGVCKTLFNCFYTSEISFYYYCYYYYNYYYICILCTFSNSNSKYIFTESSTHLYFSFKKMDVYAYFVQRKISEVIKVNPIFVNSIGT